MLGDGGRLVAVGITPADVRTPIDVTRIVRRGLRIVGSYGGRPRADMPNLLALIEQGVVRPESAVTQRFALEDVNEAYGALERRAMSAAPSSSRRNKGYTAEEEAAVATTQPGGRRARARARGTGLVLGAGRAAAERTRGPATHGRSSELRRESAGQADLPGDAGARAGRPRRGEGPVVLCGHPYGGVVITEAASGQTNVRHSVYLCAFMPDERESIARLLRDGWRAVAPSLGRAGRRRRGSPKTERLAREVSYNDCIEERQDARAARRRRRLLAWQPSLPAAIAWERPALDVRRLHAGPGRSGVPPARAGQASERDRRARDGALAVLSIRPESSPISSPGRDALTNRRSSSVMVFGVLALTYGERHLPAVVVAMKGPGTA